ncbi:hypothetical protein CDD83_10728 [Cordyceps sp. RAO-2017]|nr:hypothetical protein CDD83_10728 [Cordyceps sp. RAO-2017]
MAPGRQHDARSMLDSRDGDSASKELRPRVREPGTTQYAPHSAPCVSSPIVPQQNVCATGRHVDAPPAAPGETPDAIGHPRTYICPPTGLRSIAIEHQTEPHVEPEMPSLRCSGGNHSHALSISGCGNSRSNP